jgi:DNA-binding NtrC family response regulator
VVVDPHSTTTTRVLTEADRPDSQRVRAYQLRMTPPSGTVEVHRSTGSVMRVGSRKGNDVIVPDEAVSRIHFEISVDPHGFRLRDLGSTNGTLVQGTRCRDVYLRAGARIQIGATEILFEPLADELEIPLFAADRFGDLVGRSAAMRELFAKLERAAPSDYTVLVQGESGTGKELVAEALHGKSRRAKGPFVVFDCAAIAAVDVEVELFGHERGAPTGAPTRAGCLQEADGGTLFLDEIGEFPLDLQPKLLRLLERSETRRAARRRGAEDVDVRIIAATNRDLAREVNLGSFRDDLYWRLAVIRLELPRLCDRPDDVRLLVEQFVRRAYAQEPARADEVLAGITAANWRRLETHPWPGNVRELRNVIHRALVLSGPEGPASIGPGTLDRRADSAAGPPLAIDWDRAFLEQRNDLLSRFEREYVLGMLDRHGGKITPAAQAAGLDRSHFKRLLARVRR